MIRVGSEPFFDTLARGPQTYGSEDFEAIPSAANNNEGPIQVLVFKESEWVGNNQVGTKVLGLILYLPDGAKEYYLRY